MTRIIHLSEQMATCELDEQDVRRSDLDLLRGLVDLGFCADEGTMRSFLETFAASLPQIHIKPYLPAPRGADGETMQAGADYSKLFYLDLWQVKDIAAGVMLVCNLALHSRGLIDFSPFSDESGAGLGSVTLTLPHCLKAAETGGGGLKATENGEPLPAGHSVTFTGGLMDGDLDALERAGINGDEGEERRIWSSVPRTLAAAVLASIANGTASQRYTVDEQTRTMTKSSEGRFFDTLFELAASDKIICCAYCGKPRFKTRANARHFCSDSTYHQNRYNDEAQAMLYAGASVDDVAAAYPYIKRTTIEGWQL